MVSHFLAFAGFSQQQIGLEIIIHLWVIIPPVATPLSGMLTEMPHILLTPLSPPTVRK